MNVAVVLDDFRRNKVTLVYELRGEALTLGSMSMNELKDGVSKLNEMAEWERSFLQIQKLMTWKLSGINRKLVIQNG
jgi:hypothetical protein